MENPKAGTGNNVDNGNSPPDKEEIAMETVMQAQRFPDLLELIGQKMDLEDLWKLRQTCFTWNKEVIPALRDKQNPVLFSCDCKYVIVPTLEKATTSSSSTIAIASPPQWNTSKALSKPSLRSYTDVMRSSKTIPAGKYTLIDVNSSPSRLLVLADFFQVCGTYITLLELWVGGTYSNKVSMDGPVGMGSLRQIIFHEVPNLEDLILVLPYMQPNIPILETPAVATRDLPQLRKLSFHVKRNALNTVHDLAISMYRSLLADLLRSATELHTIEFGGGNSELSAWDTLEGVRLVGEVMSEEQVSKIKTLEIHEVRAAHLEILLDLAGRDRRKNPLRLKSFFTSIVNHLINQEIVDFDETGQLLFRFLQSQADALLELKFNTIMKHARTINFPIMPAVRNLSLKLMGNWSYQLPTPLDISFPSLVKYNYLSKIDYLIGDDMEGFGYLGLSLTDLSLETKGASLLHAYELRFQFQTITRLKIKLNGCPAGYINGFKQICATMQVLEELDFTCPTYTYPNSDYDDDDDDYYYDREYYDEAGPLLDSILTGVPKDKLGHLERVLDNLAQIGPTVLPVLQRFLSEYYKTNPGIQDLRCLKKFVMTIPRIGYRPYRLTDIGGYFGFACASHTLQHISIKGGKYSGGRPLTARRSQVGRLSECQDPGNLVSAECEEMIRSVMSPPKILRFD